MLSAVGRAYEPAPAATSATTTGQEELKRPKEGYLSAPFDDTFVVVLRGGRECSDYGE